jgi:transcriptional regulator with XRE-family HTH domain
MTAVTSLAFGLALKRARRAARLTQAELAERAGFSVVYISMLERGARQPQRTTLALLADALALSSAERVALEAAAPDAAERRRGDDGAGTPQLPVGGFLGALPSGQLMGRERERAVIGAALEAVASGQGRLLMLVGEPGVGKTRLAQEIVVIARAQGFQLLTGRCYEPQQSLAYAPFLEALSQAVTLLEADVPGQAPVAERWPEVARLLPDSALPTAAPSAPDDRSAQQRLFAQVRRLLAALAERQPLALLLDDLHWADAASLDLLQYLARHMRDQLLLLVGTTRAVEAQRQHPLVDALSELRRDDLVQQLALPPLQQEETAALVGATLGGADGAQGDATTISAELAARIQARSEGNAFFARQLARALQEQGELTFTQGRWRLSASAASAGEPPESIRSVIALRLGRLALLTQEVLREASVLGQVVDFEELRHMGGRGEQEVEEALEEAGQAGVMREGGRDQYHFNHALTRDTLYAQLAARRKRRLHLATADAIEALPNPERRAAELSYHFLAADERERALPYVLLAGDQAAVVYAHAGAEQHYRSAIALAAELGDRAHEANALAKLTTMLTMTNRDEEAIAAGERAVRLGQTLGDREGVAAATLALARARAGRGRGKEAYRYLADLIVFLTADEPPEPLERSFLDLLASARAERATAGLSSDTATFLCTARAITLAWEGRLDDALVASEQARVHAQRASDMQLICQAYWNYSELLRSLGRVQAALDAAMQAVQLAREGGEFYYLSGILNNAAMGYGMQGEMAHAERLCADALAAGEQAGAQNYVAHALWTMAELAFITGEWPRAQAHLDQARDLVTAIGFSQFALLPLLGSGHLWLAAGERERGMDALGLVASSAEGAEPYMRVLAEQGLAEMELVYGEPAHACARLETDAYLAWSPLAEVQLAWLLPWAHLEMGEVERAAALIEPVVADARAQGMRVRLADALRILALVQLRRDQHAAAAEALDEACAQARSIPYPWAEVKALSVYGQLHVAAGEPEQAREKYQAALMICDRLGEGLYRPHIERDLRRLAQKR